MCKLADVITAGKGFLLDWLYAHFYQLPTAGDRLLWLMVWGVAGLFCGSFAAAWSWRLVRGIPVFSLSLKTSKHEAIHGPNRSFCPACQATLGPLELVPLLSWLWLGGRCRHCGVPVSPRYPAIELSASLLCMLVFGHIGPLFEPSALMPAPVHSLPEEWLFATTFWFLASMLGLLLMIIGGLTLAVMDMERLWLHPAPMVVFTIGAVGWAIGAGGWALSDAGWQVFGLNLGKALLLGLLVEGARRLYSLWRKRRAMGGMDVLLLISISLNIPALLLPDFLVLSGMAAMSIYLLQQMLWHGKIDFKGSSRVPFGAGMLVGFLAVLVISA